VLLAQTQFANETASGWLQANSSAPIAFAADAG
jgi:hypothetical protein